MYVRSSTGRWRPSGTSLRPRRLALLLDRTKRPRRIEGRHAHGNGDARLYDRQELIDRYAGEGGRDLSEMHWYVVFGYFKLAGILQQIYARYKDGQTTDDLRHLRRAGTNLDPHAEKPLPHG